MKTSHAVSPIATSQVAISFVGFILVYSFLGLVAFSLMAKHAKKGPETFTPATT
jgi:Bacterial Cytochrome Ubiquinol Oxidase.